MHKNREDLFRLFQENTGKTVHVPKGEPALQNMQAWQPSRVNVYYAQSNQFQRWK